MGLFATRKGDREIMLTKRKGAVDGRPALQMIQLVDSEEESVKPASNTKKRLRRNFFKRSKPVFCKFDDEICSPSNAYQPPPAHLFPSVAVANSTSTFVADEREKTITIAGTHSTDSSSTIGLHEYHPPTFRIAALEPSMSVEEIQRACSPSVESDRRSSSSFVQFAFDPDFQRIEELAMFGEPMLVTNEVTKDEPKKTKAATTKKKENTSLDFPTVSFENLAMKDAELSLVVSPSQSMVSFTNATVPGFEEVPMTYTEETMDTDPFIGMNNEVDVFSHSFKIDAIASHSSGELLGTKWVEAKLSFPEAKETRSHDSSSLIDSIRRPKKSSSWDLESRKPKKTGTRDPSPRCAQPSNSSNLSDQQWDEQFGVDKFPEGGAITQVFKEQISSFHAHSDEFPEASPANKVFDESCSDFVFDKHVVGQFSEVDFLKLPSDAQPVNEIVINEQTNCIKGLPASAIAASMIFRQTIAVNEEVRPCNEGRGDFEDSGSLRGGYFPDGTPMEVLADREDALTSISSLTEGASSFHKKLSLDVWGRQAQNVINHWNFAAKKVREEMTPSPSKKSIGCYEGSAKKSVSDELMNMFSP